MKYVGGDCLINTQVKQRAVHIDIIKGKRPNSGSL